jgi:hypothetical protein
VSNTDLFDRAVRYWSSPMGLVIASVVCTGLSRSLTLGLPLWVTAIVFVLGQSVVTAAWVLKNRLPCVTAGKVGIAIAVAAEGPDEQAKLRTDFCDTIKWAIHSRDSLEVLVVPPRYAAKAVDRVAATTLMERTRARVLVYGRCRKRHDVFVIELRGIVRHAPLPNEVRDALGGEFGHLLPERIDLSDNALDFEVTAGRVQYVARYIIGLAAFLSGDPGYAIAVFETLAHDLPKLGDRGLRQELAGKLRCRTADARAARAQLEYLTFRTSRDPAHLETMRADLERLEALATEHPEVGKQLAWYLGNLLWALYHFLAHRDVDAAMGAIRRCRDLHTPDTAWRFSEAFLLAYSGKVADALRIYRKALAKKYTPLFLFGIEEFIADILSDEPERYHLHMCLGFLNLHFKGDNLLANYHFGEFLRRAKPEELAFVAAAQTNNCSQRQVAAGHDAAPGPKPARHRNRRKRRRR